MTSEEILEQVQTAAGEAAEKLTLKKPASTVRLYDLNGGHTLWICFVILYIVLVA